MFSLLPPWSLGREDLADLPDAGLEVLECLLALLAPAGLLLLRDGHGVGGSEHDVLLRCGWSL